MPRLEEIWGEYAFSCQLDPCQHESNTAKLLLIQLTKSAKGHASDAFIHVRHVCCAYHFSCFITIKSVLETYLKQRIKDIKISLDTS